MTARPRMLVLTPRFPYPVIGGDRLRIHNVCRILAQRYSLTLLSFAEDSPQAALGRVDDDVFDRIEIVTLSRWQSYLGALKAIFSNRPLQLGYYHSSQFRRKVQALAGSHDFALAHLIRVGQYLETLRGPVRILEMTDAISMNYKRVSQRRKLDLRSLVYRFEAARLERYERSMAERFDLVDLISADDARFLFGAAPPDNVVVATNGADMARLRFVSRERNSVVAFIGNMSTLQNLDACEYFIHEILPLLPRELISEFRIVGRIDGNTAEKLGSHDRVVVTGEVADLNKAVAGASVGVAPVRIGAGVQNKILDYMALGLPTVVTGVGQQGLQTTDGDNLLVADEPAAFAAAVARLIGEKDLADRLAVNGRAYVERYHDWGQAISPLVSAIADLAPENLSAEQGA